MSLDILSVTQITDGTPHAAWDTALDASSTSPQEELGVVRVDRHPVWGKRAFLYGKFTQSVALGEPCRYTAPVALTLTAGTTTSGSVVIASDGLYNGYFASVFDDAGAAGAAPEGEVARIKKSTTAGVELNPDDALSAALAANDVLHVSAPWSFARTAGGESAALVAGVSMAAQDADDYGWLQFYGIHPQVVSVAAGTALTEGASVISGARLVTAIGAATLDQVMGIAWHGLASDTVQRTAVIKLACGLASSFGA